MSKFNLTSQVKPLIKYLKKKQENDRFLKSVEIIATLLLIIFFSVFAILPTAKTISALLGEIESKKVLVKSMRSKINQVVMAQDSFSKIQAKYLLVESSLPTSQRFFNAATQLQLAGAYAQIPISDVSFGLDNNQIVTADQSNHFMADLALTGNFLSMIDLVKNIEDNRRLNQISSVRFSPYKTKNKNPVLDQTQATNLSVGINFFYWPNNETKE